MKNNLIMIVVITIILLISIISVVGKTEDKINTTSDSEISIYIDKETGVNYYIYEVSDRGGMTVRLNPDGTPYVSKK